MSFDAIDVLGALGYTDREATFLYLTAIHSGYFLRRHFTQFVARERGGVATNLIRKAIELRHVNVLPCSDGRYIYHLSGKAVYRLLERGDSQNRRMKSPSEILRRLIALDYILLRLRNETFVESQGGMKQLFAKLKIELGVESFQSVLVSFRGDGSQLTVRFAFVDEGQRSTTRFARFMESNGNHIRAIDRAEVTFVAASPLNFLEAERLFQRHMPLRAMISPACPRGVDHLVDWLEIRHRFHSQRSSITPTEHRILLEGDHLYHAPVHLGLMASWANGTIDAEKVRRLFHLDSRRAVFETELIDASYPKLLIRSAGKGAGGLRGQNPVQNMLFTNEFEDVEGAG
jgi:hypothetical protein